MAGSSETTLECIASARYAAGPPLPGVALSPATCPPRAQRIREDRADLAQPVLQHPYWMQHLYLGRSRRFHCGSGRVSSEILAEEQRGAEASE